MYFSRDPFVRNQINIVIADAQPIFLDGLRHILGTVKRFNIIGEAANGEAALKIISDKDPDVAILGIDLSVKDGFEVARTVFSKSLPVKMIFLTKHKSRSCFNAALNLGVKGYVLKNTSTQYLIDAVNEVSDGNCFICPQLSNFLIKRNHRKKLFTQSKPAFVDLTTCEKRILILVSQYMTSRQIADELFVSVRTVEHHREHISQKLNLRGRNSLLKFAIEHHDELI